MVDNPTPQKALQALIEKAGSQSELARALGITNTSVWKWVRFARPITAEYVLKAEELFGVSRHDLRPDLYPREGSPAARRHSTERTVVAHRLSEGAV